MTKLWNVAVGSDANDRVWQGMISLDLWFRAITLVAL